MTEATRKFMHQCEEESRSAGSVQKAVAAALREFDAASDEQRRALYERAIFLQYGLLARAIAHEPDIVQAIEEQQAQQDQ